MEGFYNPEEKTNDFEDGEFGLGDLDADLLEQASEVLMFLESIEWKWDIRTILEQPGELTKAVMRLRLVGQKLVKDQEHEEG